MAHFEISTIIEGRSGASTSATMTIRDGTLVFIATHNQILPTPKRPRTVEETYLPLALSSSSVHLSARQWSWV